MNLIICFCIIFIGILIFWEFSKKLLIKTIESLASTNSSTIPGPIQELDLSTIVDTAKEINAIQSKLNEGIRAFNKLQEDIADAEEEEEEEEYMDEDFVKQEFNPTTGSLIFVNTQTGQKGLSRAEVTQTTTKVPATEKQSNVVYIKELDLSTIVGVDAELRAVQSKLNEVIGTLNNFQTEQRTGPNITKLDLSKTVGTEKEINAVQFKLNEMIRFFNELQTDIYEDAQKRASSAEAEAAEEENEAETKTKENEDMNTWLENR